MPVLPESEVTVVIANYNRCEDLREALRSVRQQEYPRVEVIVVDNASRDGSRQMLAAEFPEVTTIPLSENVGFDAYSIGFQNARGQVIFQMDNDSLIPDRTVLSEVVSRFANGPQGQAVVATRVEEYRAGLDSIDNVRARDTRRGPIDTGGFHSGGVAFLRSYLEEVGYYNREVFLYASELFLQMKFLHAGLRVLFYPEILMLHKSSPVARSSQGLYFEMRNRYWFMRHFGTRAQQARYLPPMLLRDSIYALSSRAPANLARAVRDGFGQLPPSLRAPSRSSEAAFVEKVNEVGSQFGILRLFERIRARMRT